MGNGKGTGGAGDRAACSRVDDTHGERAEGRDQERGGRDRLGGRYQGEEAGPEELMLLGFLKLDGISRRANCLYVLEW